jgi:hypothetical protein
VGIKDLSDFVRIIKDEKVKFDDILINFYVTKIPLDKEMQIVTKEEIAKACLCFNIFSYQGEFYEQMSILARESPLSLIVSNF